MASTKITHVILDERKTFEYKNNQASDTLKNWYQFEELCRLELINHTLLLHGFILLHTSWYCYCCCVFFVKCLSILRYMFRVHVPNRTSVRCIFWSDRCCVCRKNIRVSSHRNTSICRCWLAKQQERPVRRYTLFTIYFRTKFNMGY